MEQKRGIDNMNKKMLIKNIEQLIETAQHMENEFRNNYKITKSKESLSNASYFLGQKIAYEKIIEILKEG